MTKQELYDWCDAHFPEKRVCDIDGIPTYEKEWYSHNEFHEQVWRLRIWGHIYGGDFVIESCAPQYSGDSSAWRGCNLGRVQSIEHLETIYNWFEEREKLSKTKEAK